MRIVFSEDENEECSIRSNNRYIRGGALLERCEYLDLWNQLSKKIPATKTEKEIVATLVDYLVNEVKAAIVAKKLDKATTDSLLAEVDAIRTTFGEENTTIGSINAISLQYSILFTKLVMPIDEKDFNEITTFYKDITAYREKCDAFLDENPEGDLSEIEGYDKYKDIVTVSEELSPPITDPINYASLFLEKKRSYLKHTNITDFLAYPFDTYIEILSHGDDWKDYKKLMTMKIIYVPPFESSPYYFRDFFRNNIGILAIDYLTIREMLDSLLTYSDPFFYCGLSYDVSITDGIPMNPFTFTYHDLNHLGEYKLFSTRLVEFGKTVETVVNKNVKPYYKYITSTEFEKDNPERKKIQYSNFIILFLCLHEHFIRTPKNFKIFKKDVENDRILNEILAPGLFYSGSIFEAMIPPSYRTSEEIIQDYLTLCKKRFLDAQTAFFASTGGGRRRKTNKRKRKTARKRKTYRQSK